MDFIGQEQKASIVLEKLLRQREFTNPEVLLPRSLAEKRYEKERLDENRRRVALVVSDYLQDHSAVTSVDIADAIFLTRLKGPLFNRHHSHLCEYTTTSGNPYLLNSTEFKHMTLTDAIQRTITIPIGDKIKITSNNEGIRPNNLVYYTDEQRLFSYISERLEEPEVITTHNIVFSITPIKKSC